MNDGDGMHSDKGLQLRPSDRAIHVGAVGIRTIQYDEAFSIFRARFHGVMEGADVRIESRAYILDIKNENIDIGQLLRGRLVILSIKRNQRYAGSPIHAVVDRFAVGSPSPKTMFRTKYFGDVYAPAHERIGEVCFADDGRIIYQQTYPLSL